MSGQVGRFVTSKDGTKIWAEDGGNKAGIPVVFIHGLSCTGHAWDKQFGDKKLLEHLHLVRYELRGHARSDYPMTEDFYTQEKYAEDFMAVIESFGLKKPFACAWSLGAATVCDVAQVFGPDVIAGTIFSGGPVMTLDHHKEWIHNELKTNLPSFLSHDGDLLPIAANVFVDSCLKHPQRDLPFEARVKWLGGFLMQPPTVRTYTFLRGQKWDRWEKEFTRTPHLLIQGQDDKHSETMRVLPLIKKVIPDIEIKLVDDIGHSPCWEVPELHNAYLLEFVQRISGHDQ
ncbi:hypothetical protein EUX98_g5074 [Antrodiella citrinella]|uniref:AB hydrolase-1 domain-containing protein n=1 Tax=Antrodiella citrinella TaxID=2447956 RepID=A0A4S4N0B6_9APHY|nr:hypothetical protein EUX98_g5074 [Antrodiella citrinella]